MNAVWKNRNQYPTKQRVFPPKRKNRGKSRRFPIQSVDKANRFLYNEYHYPRKWNDGPAIQPGAKEMDQKWPEAADPRGETHPIPVSADRLPIEDRLLEEAQLPAEARLRGERRRTAQLQSEEDHRTLMIPIIVQKSPGMPIPPMKAEDGNGPDRNESAAPASGLRRYWYRWCCSLCWESADMAPGFSPASIRRLWTGSNMKTPPPMHRPGPLLPRMASGIFC